MSISGMPQRESGVVSTKSQHRVSSSPPPMHTPSTAAMVTTSTRPSSMAAVSWNMETMRKVLACGLEAGSGRGTAESKASLRVFKMGNSAMSSPAQNVLPAPEMTRTLALSSKRTARTASCNCFCIDTDKALCFSGRLRMIRRTGPSIS